MTSDQTAFHATLVFAKCAEYLVGRGADILGIGGLRKRPNRKGLEPRAYSMFITPDNRH